MINFIGMPPIKTYGLTHIALAVKDTERSLRFYQQVFGVVATHQQKGWVQAETPGCHDVIVLEEKEVVKIGTGGIAHFGFRLMDPNDIEIAVKTIKEAGGSIIDKGEFCPGEPYIFFTDPDGYELEIWYEP